MRAKTRNLIIFLCAILSVVFAFICGPIMATASLNVTAENNTASNLAYLSRQKYVVVNDTTTSPILFGEGVRNTDVSIHYSYGYSIDVRIRYSLAWSNSASTQNVILNFADRDNYIVDDEYIYYVGSISGTGVLRVFTGVNFVDPTDANYARASLTITISEVIIKKANSETYDSGHSMYLNRIAGNAWLKKKDTTAISSDAYVVAYNYRNAAVVDAALTGKGISYPTTTAEDSVSTKLYGNRYYAGVSLYVIAKNATQIRVKIKGAWILSPGINSGATFNNNSLYNFSSGWSTPAATEADFSYSSTYNYVIPAGTACYIPVCDSIEITSVMYTNGLDYSNSLLYTSFIDVNGTNTFASTSSDMVAGTISTGSYGKSTNYLKSDVTFNNTSLYEQHKFDTTAGNSVTFYTCVNVVNNTNAYKKVTITAYKLDYVLSNGNTNITYWVRENKQSTNISVRSAGETSAVTTFTLAPYSSVNIADRITAAAALKTELNTYTGGSSDYNNADYDVWMGVDYTYTVTSPNLNSDSENLNVEFRVNAGTLSATIKNLSDELCTVTTSSIKFYVYSTSAPSVSVTAINGVSSYQLKPNERATLTLSNTTLTNFATENYYISAGATGTWADDGNIYLVNAGKTDAYVVNTSNSQVTIKYNGTGDDVVVQPGQIITVANTVTSIVVQ